MNVQFQCEQPFSSGFFDPDTISRSYGTGMIYMIFRVLTFLFFYPVNPVRILRSVLITDNW